MIYPLPLSNPIQYNLMDYFNFQAKLTDHLDEEKELEYYQNEIRHILLLFDIRLENELTIAGTGKQREFMFISSIGLFNRFYNEIFNTNTDMNEDFGEGEGLNVYEDESKYKFIDYEDKISEVDIRDVSNMKKAGLFIHKFGVPYNKPPKDGCGNISEINYWNLQKNIFVK